MPDRFGKNWNEPIFNQLISQNIFLRFIKRILKMLIKLFFEIFSSKLISIKHLKSPGS